MSFHKSKKQLVLQKISIKENNQYKKHLENIFTDPNQYFSSTFNGNEVVIGKRHSTQNNVLSFPQYQSNRKSVFYLKGLRNQMNTSKSVMKCSENKSQIGRGGIQLPPNKRYIDDQEIKDIFDKYKEIKIENTLEQTKNPEIVDKKLLEQFDKTSQKEVGQILNFQEKVLRSYESTAKEVKKIEKNLSKKIKRKQDDLLMTRAERFRISKEIKDLCTKEVQSRNPQPIYKWVLNLRDDSNHYINFGSIKNPKWQLIVSPRNTNETIRNPEIDPEFFRTQVNINDQYLKKKFSNKAYSKFSQTMSRTMTGFKKMSINGKDLLQFEIDNYKSLKGKKIITTTPGTTKLEGFLGNIIEKASTEETYGNNVNTRELMRRKGKTTSDLY